MARALQRLYNGRFEEIAALLYRSIAVGEEEPELARFFEELAEGAVEQFQLLGRAIVALGSDPIPQLQHHLKGGRGECAEGGRRAAYQALLYDTLTSERRFYEACSALLGCIEEGLIGALLAYLQQEVAERIGLLSAVIAG